MTDLMYRKNRNGFLSILMIALIISSFSCADFSPARQEVNNVISKTAGVIRCTVKSSELPAATDETGQKITGVSSSESGTYIKALKNTALCICVSQNELPAGKGKQKTVQLSDAVYSENLLIVNYLHDSDGMKG